MLTRQREIRKKKNKKYGGIPEWPKGADCKSVALASMVQIHLPPPVFNGRIAQLGEHLPYKQGVTGSSPVVPTIKTKNNIMLAWLNGRAADL